MPLLSQPLEDYLFDIYLLFNEQHDENTLIRANDIGFVSGTTLSSVNRAITSLREKEFIHHLPYQGVRLTEKGLLALLPRIRKHRILETFLYDQMKFEWHQVHGEAQTMNVGVSEAVIERMWTLLDFPCYSPYGECIPQLTDTLQKPNDIVLHHSPINTPLRISRVVSRDKERLKYIHALKLLPNTTLEVIHIAPFDGPMQLKLNDEFRIVGRTLAELIRVQIA